MLDLHPDGTQNVDLGHISKPLLLQRMLFIKRPWLDRNPALIPADYEHHVQVLSLGVDVLDVAVVGVVHVSEVIRHIILVPVKLSAGVLEVLDVFKGFV